MIGDFIYISAISLAMIFITCLIIYEIFRVVWVALPRMKIPARVRVILVVIPIFFAHILNIWLYALIYFLIENYTGLGAVIGGSVADAAVMPALKYSTFFDCLYFSSATYTTLGFGDLVSTNSLRMLTATEALNGLVLLGWTISFTYLAMEDFWKMPHNRDKR